MSARPSAHARRPSRPALALVTALALVVPALLADVTPARADAVPDLITTDARVAGASQLYDVDVTTSLRAWYYHSSGWVEGTSVSERWVDAAGAQVGIGPTMQAGLSDLGRRFVYEATATTPEGATQTVRSEPLQITLASGPTHVDFDAQDSPAGPAFVLPPEDRFPATTSAAAGDIAASYTWSRDGMVIPGGGGDSGRPWSHRLTDADTGHRLSASMTLSQASTGLSATFVSSPTEPLGTWTMRATLSVGTLRPGEWVGVDASGSSAYPDVWADGLTSRLVKTYQWLRDGAPIYGATQDIYRLTRLDAGRRISARVTARAPGYPPRTVVTTATAAVSGTYTPVSLSGDGYRDIVVREQGYLVGHNGFRYGIGWGGAVSSRPTWGSWVTGLAVGDLSGDGRDDIVARDSSGILWVYRTDATNQSGGLGRGRLGAGWNSMDRILAGADYDGDRYGDVMARRASDGALVFYAGRGPLGLAAGKVVGTGFGNRRVVTVGGDMNRDGKPDMYSMTAAGNLYFHAGLGGGRVAAGVLVEHGWGGYTSILRAGDLTGDGRADLLARDAYGWLWLYPGEGDGHLGTRRISNRVLQNNQVAFKVPSSIA